MVLPFHEEIVNAKPLSKESFANPNFVGYLNPYGDIISSGYKPDGYNYGELGPHYINFGTDLFLQFMPIEPKRKYKILQFLEKNKGKSQDELRELLAKQSTIVQREYLSEPNSLNDAYVKLRLDIYRFFNNCYLNEDFFVGMGRDKTYVSYTTLAFFKYKEIKQQPNENYWDYSMRCVQSEFTELDTYFLECIKYLKDVFVQYLGYHSVERLPKTITTSSFRIYEEFYNYLLNGFTIVQIPKMVFDPNNAAYSELIQQDFMIPDSELRLKDEIESIRRRVPPEDLYRFYR